MADLNRAIELDPENGEYYFLRYSMRRLEVDISYIAEFEGAIELGNLPYTRESMQAKESDFARAIALAPSIAVVLRDRQRAMGEGISIPGVQPVFRPNFQNFNPDEFPANPPKPIEIEDTWRLKCLRD